MRLFLIALAIVALLPFTAHAAPPPQPAKVLRIRVPPAVVTRNFMILGGDSGGLDISGGNVRPHSAPGEYQMQLWPGQKTARVLIFAPGYRMVGAVLTGAALRQVLAPRLVKLPTTPLRLRLVNAAGHPLRGVPLSLNHTLEMQPFFEYSDGMVTYFRVLQGVTDANGEVAANLPVLTADPHFTRYPLSGGFAIATGGGRAGSSSYLMPNVLPVAAAYPGTVVITRVLPGTLRGTISNAFYKRHNVVGDITPYMDAKRKSIYRVEMNINRVGQGASFNGMLKGNQFKRTLPAGTYDLELVIFNQRTSVVRRIPVRTGVQVGESAEQTLTIE